MHLDAFGCIWMHFAQFPLCISVHFANKINFERPAVARSLSWFGLAINLCLKCVKRKKEKCLKIRDWKFYMHRHVKRFRVMVAGDIWMGGEKIF